MKHTYAANIRALIKQAGINARVRVAPGDVCVQVFTCAYGLEFSEDEQRTIRTIAKEMGFTRVRQIEIDIERMTDPFSFNFYI